MTYNNKDVWTVSTIVMIVMVQLDVMPVQLVMDTTKMNANPVLLKMIIW